MTDHEHQLAHALARCTFIPGSWPKRFSRDLASYPKDKVLTEPQRLALWRVAWKFRKQLKSRVSSALLAEVEAFHKKDKAGVP